MQRDGLGWYGRWQFGAVGRRGNRSDPVTYDVLGNAIDRCVEARLVGGRVGREVHLIDGHAMKYRPVGKRRGDRGPIRCGYEMEAAPKIECVALAPVIGWKALLMGNSDQLAKLLQRSADRFKFGGPGEEVRPGKNLD